VWNLLLRPDLDETARGSARHVVVVANSREQARITLTFAREFCERSGLLRSELIGVREDKIVFKGGRILLAVPCADRVARGLRASALIFDEAGHFLSEAYGPRTLERIHVALRPSLVTFGDRAKLFMGSTPGESGFFTAMFEKAQAGEIPGAAAFTAPTLDMNPLVDAAFLEQERASLGDADFRREHLGEFIAGGTGGFFVEEDLRACVGRYTALEPSEGTSWVLGLDPSFSSDPSGIAIVGRARDDRKRCSSR
jgi:phage terminase large subunit-like protein